MASAAQKYVEFNLAGGNYFRGDTSADEALFSAIGVGGLGTPIDITESGGHFAFGSKRLQLVAAPVASTDAANKAYVDSVAQGLDVKQSVRLTTYSADTNWTTSVTADVVTGSPNEMTISGLVAGASLGRIDGVEPSSASTPLGNGGLTGDRILLKNLDTISALTTDGGAEAAPKKYHGIWRVVGGTTTTLVLRRTADADTSAEVTSGLFTFVEQGTANDNTGWVVTTNDPIVLDTTAVDLAQFSGAGTFVAGTGISISGNVISSTATLQQVYNADVDAGDATITTNGTDGSVVIAGSEKFKVTAAGAAEINTANAASSLLIANSGGGTAIDMAGPTSGIFGMKAASTVTDYDITWPAAVGSNGQYLQTNASGVLSWVSIAAVTTTLQDAYDNDVDGSNALITTNATDGSVVIAGTEKLQVTAAGGIDINASAATTSLSIANSGGGTAIDMAGSTSGIFGMKAAATVTSYDITWPAAVGSNGQFLQTNASGVLSWATVNLTTTLQDAYDNDVDGGGATITTNATDGNVVIAGTEKLQVTAAGGIDINASAATTSLSIANSGGGTAIDMAGSTSGIFGQKAAAVVTSYDITWPAAAPSANGQVLNGTTGGVLSWSNPGSLLTAGDAIAISVNTVSVDFTKQVTNGSGTVAVAAGDIVAIGSAGTFLKADATAASTVADTKREADIEAEIGIVAASIAVSVPGAVVLRRGAIVAGFTGLTLGKLVYVSKTAGGTTQSVAAFTAGDNVYSIGRAYSATEVVYDPQYIVEV